MAVCAGRVMVSSAASVKVPSSATRKVVGSPFASSARQTRRRTRCFSRGWAARSSPNSAGVQRRPVTMACSRRRIWSDAIVRTSFFRAANRLWAAGARSGSSLAPGLGRDLRGLPESSVTTGFSCSSKAMTKRRGP
ncbi:hypothetical protein BJF79_30415 [Actinomadura sp. CNU-125]|nr:hypothetical protein BJF79_30415 [Actinomadura sp. CNU-125]